LGNPLTSILLQDEGRMMRRKYLGRFGHNKMELLDCIVLYCIVLYCIVLYCIVLYCIVLHCIVLYCIVLYCIVLYCIVTYSIIFTLFDLLLVCLSQSGHIICKTWHDWGFRRNHFVKISQFSQRHVFRESIHE